MVGESPKHCRETHRAEARRVLAVLRLPIPQRVRHVLEPAHIDACPLPRHPLRNGRLNQMAYSLFLFMRDVADDDFVDWINKQLGTVDQHAPDRVAACREAIIGPLRNVYGVADKVIAMTLSSLAAERRKPTPAVGRSRRDVRRRRHPSP